MLSSIRKPSIDWLIAKRQTVVFMGFVLLFSAIVVVIYLQDRRQEWRLRIEQASHRLDLAYELISRELNRVRSDALFLAEQSIVREFAGGNQELRPTLEAELSSFVGHKRSYDQVRLMEYSGREIVRIDYSADGAHVVPLPDLQNKRDRYYFRESQDLSIGDVFVSEFDLNQERGAIEQPYNPVIRFVTPVNDSSGSKRALLVLNYLGSRLLDELRAISLPGDTMVLRKDGHFLLSPNPDDQWGWLLGHDRTFAKLYPKSWDQVKLADNRCVLTEHGAFASRKLNLSSANNGVQSTSRDDSTTLLLVSYLPSEQVFTVSYQLLWRLLLLAGLMVGPLFVLTRIWAVSTIRRQQQNLRIFESEERLRELSSRLLRIQEEERKAISREIHDELGQQVTAINLDLKLAERETKSENAMVNLRRAIKENEQLLGSLHDFATRVRPAVLDDLGFCDAVESHIWEFRERTGIPVELLSDLKNVELPPVVAENVFRLLQESLNNVVKHADASHVSVKIEVNPTNVSTNGQSFLQVIVSDNGIGQALDAVDGSRLGILGMKERVDLMGGSLNIDSPENSGTTVSVQIPLK